VEVVTKRIRPKWVSGLRPKLEELLDKGIDRGFLLGKGRIVRDMLEITELRFVEGTPKTGVRIQENEVEFLYPVSGSETFEDIYYPLLRMLSTL